MLFISIFFNWKFFQFYHSNWVGYELNFIIYFDLFFYEDILVSWLGAYILAF
jgi:hypothetical protein